MNNSFQVKAADVFVTCGDFTASVCRLRNTSAVSIDYKVGEVTTALAAGAASGAINVSNSTREVSVRRSDLNSSAVSVLIEWGLTADEAYELASSEVDPVVAAHNAAAGAHLNIVRRTLAGNLTLTTADAPSQRIIPDADRDVTLPAESTAQWESKLCHGGSAYVLTIKRAGGTVVAVLVPGGVTVVAWDGVEFGAC